MRCTICDTDFPYRREYENHMLLSSCRYLHTCDRCDLKFVDEKAVDAHIKGSPNHMLCHCGFDATSFHELAGHFDRTLHGVYCGACELSFRHTGALQYHENDFTCPICDHKFEHGKNPNLSAVKAQHALHAHSKAAAADTSITDDEFAEAQWEMDKQEHYLTRAQRVGASARVELRNLKKWAEGKTSRQMRRVWDEEFALPKAKLGGEYLATFNGWNEILQAKQSEEGRPAGPAVAQAPAVEHSGVEKKEEKNTTAAVAAKPTRRLVEYSDSDDEVEALAKDLIDLNF